MSKTTEIQIEKSRNLIEGMRRHVREMGERQRVGDGTSGMRGVSNNEINEMEKTVAMLSETNAEADRLREELPPQGKEDERPDDSRQSILRRVEKDTEGILPSGALARLWYPRQAIKSAKNIL